jgi:catechol 2,3-dioxygenase
MSLRDPVFNPPFNIVRASHVELGVADIAASRAFYVDCLGYIVSDEDRDALYLRGVEERNHHSVVLRNSKDVVALVIAFKVASEEDLDKAAEWLSARGLPVSWPKLPFQGRTLRTVDPVGMPIDLYFKMDRVPSMLQKYSAYKGARIQRIDHLNCFTPDVQASYDFYTELGFRLTETTETEGADPKLWAVWMQRRGSTHDLAFTNGRGPRLHHIGVWNVHALDILNTCDVMATSGYLANMERGPGRHGIANAFFLYVRDPDGHRVELFTSDYLTVDTDHEPIRWTLDDPQRQTLWGHPAPKSWFEEGSPFAGVPVREPVLGARPVVAR